ncbi:MAG: alpha/beta hydrolase family protein [Bryobacteraceae bacterium]
MRGAISRRQLGLAAISTAALAPSPLRAQTESSKKYKGALEGFESKVDMKSFDPVAWTLERYKSAPLRLTFKATDQRDAEAWQKQLRAKLIELLGGFPETRSPLHPQTLEVVDFPGYRRERFVFESRPGMGVLGYLITPADAKKPSPAVVCVPGHGTGVDDIAGLDEEGKVRDKRQGYEYDFALQVAEHGMAAVAIEPMAFGCRRDALTASKGPRATACQPTAGAALLLGETMIGWRVYDIMRLIDWIATRPELDAKRVGCLGISGGGTCTLFTSALEPRIRAAMVSGYLNTFRDSIMSLSHCIDNYVPGILNWAEMYDIAGLIAPRPMLAESGNRDKIFPVAASNESFARVKKIYEIFGAAEAVEHEVFNGVHEFHGVRGLPFLAKALST